MFPNMIRFYGKELLARRPIPKLEDHPLSAVRDSSFNIFAATLHIGGRSSIRNLRTRHAVLTGTKNHCFKGIQINYMQRSYSLADNSSSAIPEFQNLVECEVHLSGHKSPPLVFAQSHHNTVHRIP